MSGADRFGLFVGLLLLTIITLGFYPIYVVVRQGEERNAMLKGIRDHLVSH